MDRFQHILFILFLSWQLSSNLFAQENLTATYTDANSVPNFLNICGEADEVVVRISLDGGSSEVRSNIFATVNLFEGVELVTLNPTASSVGVVMSNFSDPTAPVFSIPNLSPNGLTFVDIAFSIAANCAYVDTLTVNDQIQVFDLWEFNYNLGNQTNLTETDATAQYRDAFAIPFFTIDLENNNPKAKVGDCSSREITVINSSLNGFVDALSYQNEQGAGISISSLEVNGVAVDFDKTFLPGGDSLITVILDGNVFANNQSGNGDAFFDPNEILTITEYYCVTSCVAFTGSNHTIAYGCDDEICRSTNVLDFVELGEGAANVGFDYGGSLPEEFAGYCLSGQSTITFTNGGVEFDAGFATMFDIALGIGIGTNFRLEDNGFNITGIRIAGVDIPNFEALNTITFGTDIDGPSGLSDEDGDGFFDDLKINESIEITAFYEFDCSLAYDIDFETGCTNDFGTTFSGRLSYTDACQDRLTFAQDNYLRPTNSNSNIENFSDPDAFAEEVFFVTHTESRSVRFFEQACQDAAVFLIKVALPANVNPVINQTVFLKNTFTPIPLMDSEVENDTLYLTYDATFSDFLNGDYTLNLAFSADCEAAFGPTEFPMTLEFECPDCDCAHLWYCGTLGGPQLHGTDPPCPPETLLQCEEGIQTTGFSIKRTSLGFADPAYTIPVNPSDVNLKVGIACDEVEMRIQNVVGEAPISDNMGMVISYSNVDDTDAPEEIFLFEEAAVRLRVGNDVFTCAVTANQVSVVADTSSKRMTIDLSSCLTNLGLTLTEGDSVEFIGQFSINKDGPYSTQFRNVPDLRAFGYAVFDGEQKACDNFGENFMLARNQIAFDFPNSNDFPEGCEETQLEYRLITVNNGFSQLFPNEFRQASRVDSISFNYDPTILEAFDNITLEVSFANHPIFGNDFYPIRPFEDFPLGTYTAVFDTLTQVPSYNAGSATTFNLRITMTPTCRSILGSNQQSSFYDFDARIRYVDRFYANSIGDGSCAEAVSETINSLISYSESPSFALTPVTNTEYILFGDTAEWVVQHCNTAFEADAGLTWLAIEDQTATINVISIEDISDPNNPVQLPLQDYGSTGTNTFAYTPALLRANGNNGLTDICNFIRIKALVNQCENVNFSARTGWNCEPYSEPDWTPDLYEPCEEVDLSLALTFRDPFLDANVVDQPLNNPAICDTTTITVLLRNIDRGAVFDVQTQFIIPLEGATLIPGSVEFAYPSSADFQPVTADPQFVGTTIRGQVYQYADFTNFSDGLINDGLLGFNTISPNDSNEIKIRYSFETDCDFLSGGLSFYSFQGVKGCGDVSNFEAGESLPLIISGTEPDLSKLFQVEFDEFSVLVPNNLSTLTVNITNLTNTPTDDSDFIKLRLPSDLLYANGSTIALQPNNWNLGEPTIELQNGFRILTWPMPIDLLQGEQASFTFQINTPDFPCDAPEQEVQLLTVSQQSLFCERLAQGCQVETVTSTTGVELTNLAIGSSFRLTALAVNSECLNETEEDVTISGLITNTDSNGTSGNFTVSAHIDENNNGLIDTNEPAFEALTLSGIIVQNNAIPFQINTPIAIEDICSVRLLLTTDIAGNCGNFDIAMPIPNLENAGANQLFCSDIPQTFTTNIGTNNCTLNGNYDFTWTAIAPANTNDLSDIKVSDPTLTISHDGQSQETFLYVLETQRPNCGQSIFDTISITLGSVVDIEDPMPVFVNPGESVELEPNILIGTPPLIYQWVGNSTLSDTTIANPIATPSTDTNYTLIVENELGCADTAIFEVLIGSPVEAEVLPEVDTICAENQLQLQAFGGDVYVWMPFADNPPGGNLTFPNGEADPVFVGGVAGSTYLFDVIVTDSDFPDLPDTAQVSITIYEAPMVSLGLDTLICLGDTIQLTANVMGGNTTNYTYNWSPEPIFGQGTATPSYRPNTTTSIVVNITDGNGCMSNDAITVETEDCTCFPPTVNAINTTFGNCDGALGGAEILVDGISTDFLYEWSPNLGISNSAGNIRTELPVGGYVVTISSLEDPNCQDNFFITIQNEDGPQAIINTTPAACESETGSASLSPDNFLYTWSIGGNQAERDDLPVGTYFVTVVDPARPACENVFPVIIGDNNPLTAEVNIIAQPTCSDANGTVQIIVSGGSGNYSYSWDSGTDTQDSLAAGIQMVTVTDLGSTGCEIPVIFVLTDDVPQGTIDITDTLDVTCFGASDGGIDYTISLAPDVVLPLDTILSNGFLEFNNNNLSAGAYCIVLNDGNGCVAGGACFEIDQPDPLMVEVLTTPDCNDNGTIEVMVSGGIAPYQFTWDNLPDTSFLDNLVSDYYRLIFSDANGCGFLVDSIFVPACIECDVFTAGDSTQVFVDDCNELGSLCLEIFEDELPNKVIYDNNEVYTGTLDFCDFDFIGDYNVSTLFGQGNAGPYQLISWEGIDENLDLVFNSLAELVVLMQGLDPTGNWQLNFPTITGGNETINYGQIEILVTNIGLTSFLGFNAQFTPSAFSIDLTVGSHEVIVVDTVLGCRDTLFAEVLCPVDVCITDTIVTGQMAQYCIDTIGLNLTSLIDSAQVLCPTIPGGAIDYTLIDSTICLQYEGLTIGTDSTCVEVFDENGNADTLEFCVTVMPGILITDTILVFQDVVEFCLDTNLLVGNIVNIEDVCASENGENILFSIDSMTYCVTYSGITAGVDEACILLEDDQGNAYLYNFVITAIEITAETFCDTLFINDPRTFCLDTTELPGIVSEIFNICESETTDNADIFLNFVDYCVQYDGREVGSDTACVVICDDLGFCDTTHFCLLIEPNFDPPIANDDTDSTFAGTPKVLDIKANDILFGGEPVVTILQAPENGEAIVNLDCSVTYNPFIPFCDRQDNFIYEVCINGNPDLCDTATVLIDVFCQELTVFNAVSPNGDGANDYFHIGRIEEFEFSHLKVYNRWNNLVYEASPYNNTWPGTWGNEKDLPDGTYFYILEWRDDNGVLQLQRGYIEILR